MNLLLDTHALVWWLTAPEQLNDASRDAIGDPGNAIHISVASVWELAIKVGLGKLPVPPDLASWVPEHLGRERLVTLPITIDHALAVEQLPPHHRDPFDRLLIAQAVAEDLAIVTRDRVFSLYEARLLPC